MKDATLVLVRNGNTLLLGVKATKVCKGCLVPPGGKREDGEDLRTCAIRETIVETGVTPVIGTDPVAHVVCRNMADGTEFDIAVFVTDSFTGTPRDTTELQEVGWYPVDRDTLDRMMEGDRYWLTFALRREQFAAEIVYDKDWRVFRTSIRMNEAPSD